MSAVENFILDQAPAHKEILMNMHEVLMSFEGVTAQIKWGIPVYHAKKYFCYLNPIKKSTKVELCFVQGAFLDDPSGLLKDRGRKMIRGIYLEDLEHFEFSDELNSLISKAIDYNNSM